MTTHGRAAVESPSAEELRELAESAAQVGGELARASFGRHQQVTLKHDRSEVTEVDVAAEREIIAHIRSRRPNDAFIGEETVADGQDGTAAGRPKGKPTAPGKPCDPQSAIRDRQSICWVIDPIDGTRNYVRGLAVFTCSVAAMRAGQPAAAAVFDPVQQVMYSAALGHGTYVNGQRKSLAGLPCEGVPAPKADLLVGIPSALRPAIRQFVLHAVERHVVRNLGSVALHLALAAVGQLDVVVMGNGKLWDIAAGTLLITEAGGVATLPDGASIFPLDVGCYAGEEIPLLAGAPGAHARLLDECRGA